MNTNSTNMPIMPKVTPDDETSLSIEESNVLIQAFVRIKEKELNIGAHCLKQKNCFQYNK